MNRLVWLDYWKGFSWSNVKAYFKENKNGGIGLFTMFLVVVPNYLLSDGTERGIMIKNLVTALVVALPVLFMFYSMSLTTLSLPKVLYMSPMTETERKEFITKKWNLAIRIPNVVNILWIVIGYFLGMDALSLLFLGIHFMMCSEGTIFYRNKVSKQWEKATDKVYPVYCIFNVIISALVQIFASVVLAEDGSITKVWLAMFIGVTVLLELPLLLKLMSYKKRLIQCMTEYEATYDMGAY